MRLSRVGREPGRVAAQLDHDAVRVEVVERVTPPVVELHKRLDAGLVHSGSHRFLLLGRRPERAVVDPHRQADPIADVRGPVGLLADALELKERNRLVTTRFVGADVVEHVPDPRGLAVRLQFRVNEGKAHQVFIEPRRRLDVTGGVRNVMKWHARERTG